MKWNIQFDFFLLNAPSDFANWHDKQVVEVDTQPIQLDNHVAQLDNEPAQIARAGNQVSNQNSI